MVKKLFQLVFLLGVFAAGLVAGLLLSDEERLRLSQQFAAGIERTIEQMPDG
jgi:hypothetical protein